MTTTQKFALARGGMMVFFGLVVFGVMFAYTELQWPLWSAVSITLVATILVMWFSLGTYRWWVLLPLRRLNAWAALVAEGQLDAPPPRMYAGEAARLQQTLLELARRIQELRARDAAQITRTAQSTKTAIDSLSHGVVVVSPPGVIELTNQTAEMLFGIKAGKHVDELPQAGLAELFREVMTRRERVEPKGYENAMQVFDKGFERFFLPHGTPMFDNAPDPVGVVIVLVDATGLRAIDEAKSSLISTVSHELKTPLTSIQMSLHLLADGAAGSLNAGQRDLLRAASEDADRLHRLIQDLLDMARLQSRQNTLHLVPSRPIDLLSDAVAARRKEFESAGIRVSYSAQEDLPSVQTDVDRLRHVFDNLLVNARKYTASGGQVTLAARFDPQEPNMVRFEVADTGVGIPPEYLPVIFDRFVRVPNQRTGEHGAGLGLAIARDIVRAHGGNMGAVSTENEGSVFWFTLPVTA